MPTPTPVPTPTALPLSVSMGGTSNTDFPEDSVITGHGSNALTGVYTLPLSVQTNITHLGAVTVGTWNASVIDPQYLPTSWSNNTYYNATLYDPLFLDLGTTTSNSIFVTFDNGYLELRTLNENDNGIDLATETAGCTPVDKCGSGRTFLTPGALLAGAGNNPVDLITWLPLSFQQNITQTGTIINGTWQATPITSAYIAATLSGKTLTNPTFASLATWSSGSVFAVIVGNQIVLRTLTTNGISLTTEVTGILPTGNIATILVGKTLDGPFFTSIPVWTSFGSMLMMVAGQIQTRDLATNGISLTAEVAGILPTANVATTLTGKTLSTVTLVNPTFTSLGTWSSGTVFAVIVGNQIVLRTLATNGISLTTEVTGILPTGNVATTLTGKTLTTATLVNPTVTTLGTNTTTSVFVTITPDGLLQTRTLTTSPISLTTEVTGILPSINVDGTLSGKTLTTATLVNPTITTLGTNTTTSVFVTITPGGLLQTRTLTTSPISLTAEVTGVLPTANVATTLSGKTLTTATIQAPTFSSLSAWTTGGTMAMIVSNQIQLRNLATSGINMATEITGITPIANGALGINTVPAAGAIPIGTGSAYVSATITAGSGITVTNGAGSITIGTAAKVWTIIDQKTAGTAGGGTTAGSFQTRTLNIMLNSAGVEVSLAANDITVSAGTWMFEVTAPAYACGAHKAALQSVTIGGPVLFGSSEIAPAGTQTRSTLTYINTHVANHVYRVVHQTQNTVATNGFGFPSSFGVSESYTEVTVTKLA